MEIEPAIKQFFSELLTPLVTTAVKTALEDKQKPEVELIRVHEAMKMLHCSEPTFYSHVQYIFSYPISRLNKRDCFSDFLSSLMSSSSIAKFSFNDYHTNTHHSQNFHYICVLSKQNSNVKTFKQIESCSGGTTEDQ